MVWVKRETCQRGLGLTFEQRHAALLDDGSASYWSCNLYGRAGSGLRAGSVTYRSWGAEGNGGKPSVTLRCWVDSGSPRVVGVAAFPQFVRPGPKDAFSLALLESGPCLSRCGSGAKDGGDREVVLFYSCRQGSPFREFSNFFFGDVYEHRFPAYARRPGYPRTILCRFSEKAVMATKAVMMDDYDVFWEIVHSRSPMECKELGRSVRNFDNELWMRHLDRVAVDVVRQKFVADAAMRDLLLSTGELPIAEASLTDRIWGIGMDINDPRASDPSQWMGRNALGRALMKRVGPS